MIVAIGAMGALGACARYYISYYYSTKNTTDFPKATLLVNVLGSLILGCLISLYERTILAQWIWLLLGVGFCGAFTTFSTFSYEWVIYLQQKQYIRAISYIVVSVIVAIAAAYVGYLIFKL